MKIEQVIETSEGTVTFKGILEGEELKYVLALGLHLLMLRGAFPAIEEVANIPEGEMH